MRERVLSGIMDAGGRLIELILIKLCLRARESLTAGMEFSKAYTASQIEVDFS